MHEEQALSPHSSRNYPPRYSVPNPGAREAQADLRHFEGIHRVCRTFGSFSNTSSIPTSIKVCTDAQRTLRLEMGMSWKRSASTLNFLKTLPILKSERRFPIQMTLICLVYVSCPWLSLTFRILFACGQSHLYSLLLDPVSICFFRCDDQVSLLLLSLLSFYLFQSDELGDTGCLIGGSKYSERLSSLIPDLLTLRNTH
jgi:hypothetical protein